ncbi:MAG: M20 family metallopeptidase [Rhizobiales bacterium]|nr:M20 family metallopeptidase [Hyphomicrobiales bacterium]
MLDTAERSVAAWLAAREGEMLALLETLVNVDSGTWDKPGVDAAGEPLKAFLAGHGLTISTEPDARFGEAIRACLARPGAADQRPVVLMGHRDTVFPRGEPTRRPFRREGDMAYGPGVADMKAGLVINAFAAAAFAACGGPDAPVVVLITSDEEIASPFSRAVIEREARAARCVFNSEPSRRGPHRITRGRKGGVFMAMEVTGKAAHSGANHDKGVSAIEEIARKIPKIHALTDYARGITLNVGTIRGGQTVNTVAPSCLAEIDLRYVKAQDRAPAIEAIRAIVETCSVPGASGRLTISGEFLPLEESEGGRRLFEIYRDAAADFGFEVTAEFTGGCADSGYTAAVGCPTLCSVGPAGGGGHTPEEFIHVDSLVPCAQALAVSAMRAARV